MDQKTQPARRQSFKQYWRRIPAALMQDIPRPQRREWARDRYRQIKNVGRA